MIGVVIILLCASLNSVVAAPPPSCAEDSPEASASISLLQSRLEVVRTSDFLTDRSQQPEPGTLVWGALHKVADDARAKLAAGAADGTKADDSDGNKATVFSAVDVALPLAPPVLTKDTAIDELVKVSYNKAAAKDGNEAMLEQKNIIPYGLQHPCVVYGIGVAAKSTNQAPSFEVEMSSKGCETHAFDCTVDVNDPNVANASFHFHPWCIGKSSSAAGLMNTKYGQTVTAPLKYKTLAETQKELGHTRLDLLKFDIEGGEWNLFDELLSRNVLPDQISFELHTEGALPEYVPPSAVAGKGFVAVNRLFLALFDKGYRVISKEVNESDHACAEFVVVNVKATNKGRDQ